MKKDNRHKSETPTHNIYWDKDSKELWAVNKINPLPLLEMNHLWDSNKEESFDLAKKELNRIGA